MTGHTSEKRWNDVSDEVNRKLSKLMQFIIESEEMYDELLQAWSYHSNVDQAVADQLYADQNNGSPATAEQLAIVLDLRAAVESAHNIYQTADLNAIRRMT